MNIRMDSKEVRFRLGQNEIADLLKFGFISEKIFLPLEVLSFKVQFGDVAGVAQIERTIVFSLSPLTLEKLKHSNFDHGALESVAAEQAGVKINYKLEVDVFNSKQRGGRT